MNANAFVHWGLSLASDILEICKEGKAAAIVDAINNWYPELLSAETGKPVPRSIAPGAFSCRTVPIG